MNEKEWKLSDPFTKLAFDQHERERERERNKKDGN
jgi:hypothetical protein